MHPLTQELFWAAQRADLNAVEHLLKDARVDVLQRNTQGKFASDCVSVGNVSMDPEDVAALRHVAQVISIAIQRALLVQVEGAPDTDIERLVRAHVARVVPSPVNNGGGTLTVQCTGAAAADATAGMDSGAGADAADGVDGTVVEEGRVFRLTIAGDYAGALPSADPPWQLRAELLVLVHPDIGLRELMRLRWVTT